MVWTATLAAIALLALADQRGWLLVQHHDDLAAYHGRRAIVDRIIDGDTIEIDVADSLTRTPTTRVCLWGVNCPELGRFGKPDQPLAPEAQAFTRGLVQHRRVMLRLESQRPRDTFGRILAHVDLDDDAAPGNHRTVNEELLKAGLAQIDDRWPHVMSTRYAQIELAAKRQHVGLWAKSSVSR